MSAPVAPLCLLDTNICVYVMNERPLPVAARFRQFRLGELAVSSITVAELAFGAAKSTRAGTRERLEKFLTDMVTIPFDEAAAWHYGDLRAYLSGKGQTIGPLDLQIAAHALSLGVPLITNNVSEFERVPELTVENWFGEEG